MVSTTSTFSSTPPPDAMSHRFIQDSVFQVSVRVHLVDFECRMNKTIMPDDYAVNAISDLDTEHAAVPFKGMRRWFGSNAKEEEHQPGLGGETRSRTTASPSKDNSAPGQEDEEAKEDVVLASAPEPPPPGAAKNSTLSRLYASACSSVTFAPPQCVFRLGVADLSSDIVVEILGPSVTGFRSEPLFLVCIPLLDFFAEEIHNSTRDIFALFSLLSGKQVGKRAIGPSWYRCRPRGHFEHVGGYTRPTQLQLRNPVVALKDVHIKLSLHLQPHPALLQPSSVPRGLGIGTGAVVLQGEHGEQDRSLLPHSQQEDKNTSTRVSQVQEQQLLRHYLGFDDLLPPSVLTTRTNKIKRLHRGGESVWTKSKLVADHTVGRFADQDLTSLPVIMGQMRARMMNYRWQWTWPFLVFLEELFFLAGSSAYEVECHLRDFYNGICEEIGDDATWVDYFRVPREAVAGEIGDLKALKVNVDSQAGMSARIIRGIFAILSILFDLHRALWSALFATIVGEPLIRTGGAAAYRKRKSSGSGESNSAREESGSRKNGFQAMSSGVSSSSDHTSGAVYVIDRSPKKRSSFNTTRISNASTGGGAEQVLEPVGQPSTRTSTRDSPGPGPPRSLRTSRNTRLVLTSEDDEYVEEEIQPGDEKDEQHGGHYDQQDHDKDNVHIRSDHPNDSSEQDSGSGSSFSSSSGRLRKRGSGRRRGSRENDHDSGRAPFDGRIYPNLAELHGVEDLITKKKTPIAARVFASSPNPPASPGDPASPALTTSPTGSTEGSTKPRLSRRNSSMSKESLDSTKVSSPASKDSGYIKVGRFRWRKGGLSHFLYTFIFIVIREHVELAPDYAVRRTLAVLYRNSGYIFVYLFAPWYLFPAIVTIRMVVILARNKDRSGASWRHTLDKTSPGGRESELSTEPFHKLNMNNRWDVHKSYAGGTSASARERQNEAKDQEQPERPTFMSFITGAASLLADTALGAEGGNNEDEEDLLDDDEEEEKSAVGLDYEYSNSASGSIENSRSSYTSDQGDNCRGRMLQRSSTPLRELQALGSLSGPAGSLVSSALLAAPAAALPFMDTTRGTKRMMTSELIRMGSQFFHANEVGGKILDLHMDKILSILHWHDPVASLIFCMFFVVGACGVSLLLALYTFDANYIGVTDFVTCTWIHPRMWIVQAHFTFLLVVPFILWRFGSFIVELDIWLKMKTVAKLISRLSKKADLVTEEGEEGSSAAGSGGGEEAGGGGMQHAREVSWKNLAALYRRVPTWAAAGRKYHARTYHIDQGDLFEERLSKRYRALLGGGEMM
ncbi:unnamed protein product [Amoebophrya sp. A25]|nr:unnamed protein product [Amoebophrya sp. A25]|eukprot:GSA25T00010160001.1